MRLRLGVAVSSSGADRIGVKENLPIGKSGFDFARHIKIVIFYGLSERIRKKYPISRERYRNMGEQENFLGTQPIGKLLLKFSVPCVLSMLVSALYNIVDQVFIGQSVGYLGNAATNVVYPFTVIALAVALLIGDGAAALLSLSLGKGGRSTGNRCGWISLIVSLCAGILLTVIGYAAFEPILTLFGVTPDSHTYAADYFFVILMGIPFYVLTSGVNGMIRADGAPGYAMAATVVGAVLNLILDPIAVFVLKWGVTGAAIATVVGQVVSCVMSCLYFIRPKQFRLAKEDFRFGAKNVWKVCQLGLSSLITQISIVVIIAVANNMIGVVGPASEYGADIPLAVIGIVMKVFGIVIAFSVGIAVGGQPIAGFNYGSRDFARVKKTYKLVLIANIVVGAVSMLLFELCPQAIVSIFGSESDLYNQYADLCFRIFLGGILLCCVQKSSSIFLQSVGKPVKATLLSVSRDVVFLVPLVVVFALRFGVEGMLWAAPCADILAFLLTVLLVVLEFRDMNRQAAKMQVLKEMPADAKSDAAC